jgi:hypothetical protein
MLGEELSGLRRISGEELTEDNDDQLFSPTGSVDLGQKESLPVLVGGV